jgi:uncharacterized phage-associated protein
MGMNAIDLANLFVARFGKSNALTHMKLQKLVFFADGWNAGFKGERLLKEAPEVWRYGPVYHSLYNALSGRGNSAVAELIKATPFTDPVLEKASDDVSKLVDWIWGRYGQISAVRLSDMTHANGSPWHTMAVRYNFKVPFHLEIPDDVMQIYFNLLAKEERLIES